MVFTTKSGAGLQNEGVFYGKKLEGGKKKPEKAPVILSAAKELVDNEMLTTEKAHRGDTEARSRGE